MLLTGTLSGVSLPIGGCLGCLEDGFGTCHACVFCLEAGEDLADAHRCDGSCAYAKGARSRRPQRDPDFRPDPFDFQRDCVEKLFAPAKSN